MTDDAKTLCERLEAATGECIAALEAFGAGKAGSFGAEKPTETLHSGEGWRSAMEKIRSARGMEI